MDETRQCQITVETLFGPEIVKASRGPIAFRQIRTAYETLTILDEVQQWFTPDQPYTTREQLYEVFSFLKYEPKEYFFPDHLSGKNRILCIDCVSIESLNQNIVHQREIFKTALGLHRPGSQPPFRRSSPEP